MIEARPFMPEKLQGIVERVERLEEEKQSIAEDISTVYSEARGMGFEVKILRQIVKLRKMDKSDLAQTDEIIALYREALGL